MFRLYTPRNLTSSIAAFFHLEFCLLPLDLFPVGCHASLSCYHPSSIRVQPILLFVKQLFHLVVLSSSLVVHNIAVTFRSGYGYIRCTTKIRNFHYISLRLFRFGNKILILFSSILQTFSVHLIIHEATFSLSGSCLDLSLSSSLLILSFHLIPRIVLIHSLSKSSIYS